MKPRSKVNARAPHAGPLVVKTRKPASTGTRRGASGQDQIHSASRAYSDPCYLPGPRKNGLKDANGESAETLQHYASLYHDAPVGYAMLDSRGVIRQINRAGAGLLGRSRERLAGTSFAAFLAGKKDRGLFSRHLDRSRASADAGEIITTELHLACRASKRTRQVQLTTRADAMAKGCLLMVINDVSSIRRAQAELGAVNERLEERVNERTAQLATANEELHREFMQRQRMEKEMTEISEQERRSLGQDLHDGICQHLTGVAMMADTLSDACQRRDLPEVSAKVKALADLIRTAANDTRKVARGLQPVDLDANGLVSALFDLAARHRAPGQVQCRLQCTGHVPIQNNDVAMHLYRIAQEAIANASRHAHARNIIIRLGIQKDDIVLSIADDGTGIPPGCDLSHAPGFRMMRHRASVIGATLEVEASDAGGTVVRCILPTPL